MSGELALGGVTERLKRLFGAASSDGNVFLQPVAAERLARRLSSMRGAAMKVGQMLSLADDSLLPPEFAEALSILRASADTMPDSQVRKTLAREYGEKWRRRFQSFDFEPIAAASIGQVHTAVAADGRELALKIQYPGVSDSIDSDIDNLATAFKFARVLPFELDLDGIIQEAKVQLRKETDYRTEADYLRRYRGLLEADRRYVVPLVYDDLTTARVLAMERLHGLPLEDLMGPEHAQERRDEVCSRLLELTFRELFEFRLMQTDPNFSNYLMLADGRTLGLLDFGSTREVELELSDRYRALFGSVLAGDRGLIHQACIEIGYLKPGDRQAQVEGFIDVIQLIFEPLGFDGPYDFSSSSFTARAQEAGMELVFRRGFVRMPPPETIFLQRKIEGSLMLCARMRARVDFRSLLRPFVAC